MQSKHSLSSYSHGLLTWGGGQEKYLHLLKTTAPHENLKRRVKCRKAACSIPDGVVGIFH